MREFQPYDWYWRADDGRIYGSAENAVIDEENERYQDWLAEGASPRPWPRDEIGDQTADALQAVLKPYSIYPNLGALKVHLKSEVDRRAEEERLKYITPGDGQAMTYQQKVAEAQAYKDAADPQSADCPLLMSEVGITASTLGEVADIVLAAFAQWQQIGAAIEGIRLGAKRDIDAAADEVAARAIVDAIEWPQPAL
ncbi:hypothetical protein [Brucella intermedia]